MADGVASDYAKIKGMPVFEFWTLFDLWQDQVKKENEIIKSQNAKTKR